VACFYAFDDEVAAVVFDALALTPTFTAVFEERENEGVCFHGRHDDGFSS
jgi:hypothetical protein